MTCPDLYVVSKTKELLARVVKVLRTTAWEITTCCANVRMEN